MVTAHSNNEANNNMTWQAVNMTTAVRGWLFNNDLSVDLTTTSYLGPVSIPIRIKVVEQVSETVHVKLSEATSPL